MGSPAHHAAGSVISDDELILPREYASSSPNENAILSQSLSNPTSTMALTPQPNIAIGVNFHPDSWSPLPVGATAYNWIDGFAAIRNRLVASGELSSTASEHEKKVARYIAHSELIEGKYGMPAPVPCQRCINAGGPCIIYHPKCYDWSIERNSWRTLLGWRCSGCRKPLGNNTLPGKGTSEGCDVRWVANPGELGYAANARFVETCSW